MRKWTLLTVMALSVSGCVVAPSPYYGGPAPYYGTSIAPGYVDFYEGGYYPYYASRHIHSGYNNSYWHYRAGAARGQGAHSGGGHGGGGQAGGGGHR